MNVPKGTVHPSYLMDAISIVVAALCVWGEARGEHYEGKKAVASVIMNRVDSSRWPDSVSEVVFQKKQFFSMSGDLSLPDLQDRSWKESVQAVIDSEEDRSTEADHFIRLQDSPSWSEDLIPESTIGNHVFFKIYDIHRTSSKQ